MLTPANSTKIVKQINEQIEKLMEKKDFIVVAIDGRCSAGKTTLAGLLKKELGCNVIHADSFFLRPEQRTKERYCLPGGNIDFERLKEEVLQPLKEHKPFAYRPFGCKTGSLLEPVTVMPTPVTIVEGAYSQHPQLLEYYDLQIFLDIDADTQKERILKRNPQNAEMFFEKWIPLEEKYLETFSVREKCRLVF